MADFNINTDLKVGTGVTYSINGDSYPYYVVGWKKNKNGIVTQVDLTEATAYCKDWYANDWHVEPFDPSADNPVVMSLYKTRKNTYTASGRVEHYGCYHFDYVHASRDPSF